MCSRDGIFSRFDRCVRALYIVCLTIFSLSLIWCQCTRFFGPKWTHYTSSTLDQIYIYRPEQTNQQLHTTVARFGGPKQQRIEQKKLLQSNSKCTQTDSINPSQIDFHNCRKEVYVCSFACVFFSRSHSPHRALSLRSNLNFICTYIFLGFSS